ncbi:uncharacterized protein LOC143028839 [Oratosquilla oratoria]|uniref:uncharacterized protein LOC143028839 n=1 Tax=Oratosquilla oratoria TaxID=337810 RepID=UPI003F775A8C
MNHRWEELSEAMAQTASSAASKQKNDRPDLVSRIFKMKVDSMMDDSTKKNIFGRVKTYLYSVEWQKRGLPHVHILLWMEQRVNAELVDSVISAEIPDKKKEPRLYDIVTRCMIHGPCKGFDESHACCHGKSVNGKGKCQKDFPKPCRGDLLFGRNGYPLWEKADTLSVRKLKETYVTKYINKGCDRILFTKTGEKYDIVNEVKNYQEARYVNANEATWKIFKFPIHKSFPSVFSLDLHLEGENEVFYKEGMAKEDIENKTNEFAAGLYYHEMPNVFIYDKNKGNWLERRNRSSTLGRIRAVTSKTVELFYLRLLLTHRLGPTSFTDIRTVNGHIYPTFREAVKAMGLLNDEDTWKQTILEIINHTNDRRQLRATYAKGSEYNDEIYLDALDDIQENVWNCGGGRIVQYGLPPSRDGEKTINVIRREKSHNKAMLAEEVKEKTVLLNEKQRQCYETVMARVEGDKKYRNNGNFLDAPGGTGKSFVLNIILDTVRSKGKVALAVASSGIAATVLHGGRTAINELQRGSFL